MSESSRREYITHVKNIHMPKSPLCDDCKEGKLSKGDGIKGPSAPEADLEVGFDIIGPLPTSTEGNVYKLVGVAVHTGVGWAEGMKDKTAKSVLNAIQAILAQIRILHNHAPEVSVRFHTDMDKSFDAEVKAYCNDKAWIKTFTEGYDSNSNSVVERRNGKLKQGNRALLLSATGGRLYYEELWDFTGPG